MRPRVRACVPSGHDFSETVVPDASRATKRGALNSASIWPRIRRSSVPVFRKKTENLTLEEPALMTTMAWSVMARLS